MGCDQLKERRLSDPPKEEEKKRAGCLCGSLFGQGSVKLKSD